MSSWNNPLNNPRVGNVGKRAKGTLNDFQQFILRGNVVDLAVGIMIGAAFTGVVTAFVGDIITPLIPAGGKNSLARLVYPIWLQRVANCKLAPSSTRLLHFLSLPWSSSSSWSNPSMR